MCKRGKGGIILKADEESEEKILWERQQETQHRIRNSDFR